MLANKRLLQLSRISRFLGHFDDLINTTFKLTGMFALICLGLFLIQLRGTAKEMEAASRDADLLVQQTQKVVKQAGEDEHGTSQNINAFLIDAGLIADNINRASAQQAEDLKTINTKTIAILAKADTVLSDLDTASKSLNDLSVDARKDLNDISRDTDASLKQLPELIKSTQKTIDSTNTLITNQDIPKILAHVEAVSAQGEKVAVHVEHMTDDVEKKVHQLTKPVSFMKRVVTTILDLGYKVRLMFGL